MLTFGVIIYKDSSKSEIIDQITMEHLATTISKGLEGADKDTVIHLAKNFLIAQRKATAAEADSYHYEVHRQRPG